MYIYAPIHEITNTDDKISQEQKKIEKTFQKAILIIYQFLSAFLRTLCRMTSNSILHERILNYLPFYTDLNLQIEEAFRSNSMLYLSLIHI